MKAYAYLIALVMIILLISGNSIASDDILTVSHSPKVLYLETGGSGDISLKITNNHNKSLYIGLFYEALDCYDSPSVEFNTTYFHLKPGQTYHITLTVYASDQKIENEDNNNVLISIFWGENLNYSAKYDDHDTFQKSCEGRISHKIEVNEKISILDYWYILIILIVIIVIIIILYFRRKKLKEAEDKS